MKFKKLVSTLEHEKKNEYLEKLQSNGTITIYLTFYNKKNLDKSLFTIQIGCDVNEARK